MKKKLSRSELFNLIQLAYLRQRKTYLETLDSDSLQVQELNKITKAKQDVLSDILGAFDGNPAFLEILAA